MNTDRTPHGPARTGAMALIAVGLLVLLPGCAVVNVAGAVAGATISVAGAVVSTGITVAGKAVDLAIPDGDSAHE